MHPRVLYVMVISVWAYNVYRKKKQAISEKTFTSTFYPEDKEFTTPKHVSVMNTTFLIKIFLLLVFDQMKLGMKKYFALIDW